MQKNQGKNTSPNQCTSKDLARLGNPHIDNRNAWLNDAIITTSLMLIQRHSPYKSTRHIITPFQVEHIKRLTQTNTTKTRQTNTKINKMPHIEGNLTIIPIHTTGHWQTIIRQKQPHNQTYTCTQIDTQAHQDTQTNEYNKIPRQILQNTPYYKAARDTWKVQFTVTQGNGYDCGVLLIIIAYVYLHHPRPHTFSWQAYNTTQKINQLTTDFRKYLTHALTYQIHTPILQLRHTIKNLTKRPKIFDKPTSGLHKHTTQPTTTTAA